MASCPATRTTGAMSGASPPHSSNSPLAPMCNTVSPWTAPVSSRMAGRDTYSFPVT